MHSSFLALLHLPSVCSTFNFHKAIIYCMLCCLVTLQLCCDVFILSVYVRGSVFVFLCICVPRRSFSGTVDTAVVDKPYLSFQWVKFLLEVVAFIRQCDHTACSSTPRSSADWFASVLLCFGRISNCIDWDKQIQFYALLKSWFRCII